VDVARFARENPRMDEVIGLFPTPLLRVTHAFDDALVGGLVEHFIASSRNRNNSSAGLTHTAMLRPSDSPLLVQAAQIITPKLSEFGALLFGERMGWSIKEMWVNVLDTGGMQAMHNHANSFISGVAYLTSTHSDSRTVFMRAPGGTEFAFKNDHEGTVTGPYNADKWVGPPPEPGDLVFFPSYLLHAVPHNKGERRITLSFNAIPNRLDSWGYRIAFSG
jgi:hypothetical protein